MNILICPVCGGELNAQGGTLKCQANHCFDRAKEGYYNLLLSSKSGDKKGDSKESARARHAFLAKGYYASLKNAIAKKMQGTVLDICCGEGYYDTYDGELYGFDISKEMVRLAAKSNKNGKYFVANLANIPVKDNSIDTAIHLFAPFNDKSFCRILKPNGSLYTVIPAQMHLYEMKQVVYDTPYKNDEQLPQSNLLELVATEKITDVVHIERDDLKTLFSMTPYFYRTSQHDIDKLNNIDSLDLTVQFIVAQYKKAL